MKTAVSSGWNSIIHMMFSQGNDSNRVGSLCALFILPISSQSIKNILKGQELIKLIVFTASSATFLSKARFFFCEWWLF